MGSRDEQRRKRRSDSFRQDEADEADNWLAGLRGSGRGEPDPFAAPPPDAGPYDRDRSGPPSGSFDRPGPPPGPLDRPSRPSGSFDRSGPPSGSFDRPGPLDRPAPPDRTTALDRPRGYDDGLDRPGPLDRPASPDRTTGLDRPRGYDDGLDRPGPLDRPAPPDRTTAIERPRGFDDGDSRGSSARGRRSRGDSPSGVYGPSALPPAPPPARPNLDGWSAPEAAPAGGRRRATDDDSPSGVYGRSVLPAARPVPDPPPAAAPTEPRGRRRAREETGRSSSESYGHGPELTPIIKPLSDTPAAPTADPPPLVPIFPTLRPDAAPTSGAGRRARRAADDDPAAFTGDTATSRRRGAPDPRTGALDPRTGDAGARGGDFGGRTGDLASRTGDVAARGGDFGGRTGDLASRTGDVGARGAARTGDLGSRTGDVGARGGDFGGRTGDPGGRRRAGADEPGMRAGAGFDAPPNGRASVRGPGDPEPNGRAPYSGETTTFRSETSGRGTARGLGDPEANGRAPYTGETTMFRPGDDAGVRRQRPPLDDDAPRFGDDGSRFGDEGSRFGEPGSGRRGYDDRRDDAGSGRARAGFDAGAPATDTGSRRARAGFEAGAPATDTGRRDDSGARRRDEAMRRRPPLDEPPQQRRALDDDLPPYDAYDEPPAARRRDGRRGSGEYSDDYTSGGTRRALREGPGGRPMGPPGRPDRPDRLDRDRPDRDRLDRDRPDRDRPDRLDRDERRGRPGGGPPRAAVADPARTGPRPHRWVALLSVIAVIVVLAACGMGTWFIFKDEKNGPDSAKSSATTGPKKRDISSRDVDPQPLTEAEVFPTNNIVAVANEPPYVILSTKASNDCKVAATEQLAALLANAGCSEVVRATMKSPNQEYLITAGIFNVTSEQVAAQTFDGIKPIVDGQKGRFAGMSVGAGTGTDALVRAPTQLGWNYKGHFITYCVIARVDGNNFAQGDPYPNQITYDIVETYLDNGIIENRSVVQPDATPAASLPGSPAPS
ncbi:hypothetical protein [Dactylosporangium sp. CA-092794]|uniref:hypothetical protein n=1 Tax=Dactylosporangium sp. CA-092794 TaxID=3239929 RepID=UPI003D8FA163